MMSLFEKTFIPFELYEYRPYLELLYHAKKNPTHDQLYCIWSGLKRGRMRDFIDFYHNNRLFRSKHQKEYEALIKELFFIFSTKNIDN